MRRVAKTVYLRTLWDAMRLRSGRRSAGLCLLYGSSPCRHTPSKRQRCSTAQARAVLPYGGGATPSDRSPGAAGGTNHRVRRAWPGSRRAAPAAWPRAAPVLAIWLIRARDERARIASASALAALTAAGNPGRERLITPVSWCGTDSRRGADDRGGQHRPPTATAGGRGRSEPPLAAPCPRGLHTAERSARLPRLFSLRGTRDRDDRAAGQPS